LEAIYNEEIDKVRA